jgi:hypothetical protein
VWYVARADTWFPRLGLLAWFPTGHGKLDGIEADATLAKTRVGLLGPGGLDERASGCGHSLLLA